MPTDDDIQTEVSADNTPPPLAFRRDNAPNSVTIRLHLPKLYPGVKFVFRLRLALSKEMKDRQEKLVGQPANVVAAAQKTAGLDEVCDLLQDRPEGLGDWPESDMRAPGLVFYEYVTQAPEGSNARTILDRLVRGVNNAFWNAVAPQEFPEEG